MKSAQTEQTLTAEISQLTDQKQRHLQKLVIVATLLHRLDYPDETVASLLWECHNSAGQHFSRGINFKFLADLWINNRQQVDQGLLSTTA